jgi:hypothetical protein
MRRRTQRYRAELSPLSRSGTTKSISQGLRRIFLRVVNFLAPASKMKILFAWGGVEADHGGWVSSYRNRRAVSFACAGAHSDSLERSIASGL